MIFDTLGLLLTLLRSGAQDAYRQFFVDSMLVVQGKEVYLLTLMRLWDSFDNCHCLRYVKLN